jgi:VIT1/CCC1 family predicted Fe2+/Mn2+ transporter
MVYLSINLGVLTFIFFVLGMIKPRWPLFFMKEPTRFNIATVTTILIMISVTLFGEGHRRNEEAKQLLKPVVESPVPVPVPESEVPKAPVSK